MAYGGDSRYSSPYRSVGRESTRKEYSSVASSRHSSPYTSRVDQRGDGVGSPTRRGYSDDRRFASPPHISGDVTVATNVLDGMIDNALSSPRGTPASSFQRPDSNSRMSRDYEPNSFSRLDSGSKSSYYRPRDMSNSRNNLRGEPSVTSTPVRSRDYGRPSASTYRTNDPSPSYARNRDDESYSPSRRSRAGGYESAGRREESYARSEAPRGGTRGFDDRGSKFGSSQYGDSRNSSRNRAHEAADRTTASRSEYGRSEYRGSQGRNETYEVVDRATASRSEYGRNEHRDSRGRGEYDDRTSRDEGRGRDFGQRESVVTSRGYNPSQNDRNYASPPSNYVQDNSPIKNNMNMPPRNPASSSHNTGIPQTAFQYSTGGLHTVQSDLSIETGAFRGTPQMRGMPSANVPKADFSARSVATGVSNVSAWHNDDVLLLPKGEKAAKVAVAATAAASLILDERSVCGFETAAESISNLAQSRGYKENVDNVIDPSVLGQINEDQSYVPVSYASVQEGMRRDLIVTASVPNAADKRMGSLPMDAYQFWARCTLLVATAILKTGHNHTQMAHAAAEAVMMHGITSMHQEWLKTADHDLKTVATAVNGIIINFPGGNEQIASVASIALVTDGAQALAMERIRRSVPTQSDSRVAVEEVSSDEEVDYTNRNDGFHQSAKSGSEHNDNQAKYGLRGVPPFSGVPSSDARSTVGGPPLRSVGSSDVSPRKSDIEINTIRSVGSLLANSSDEDDEQNEANQTPAVPESYERYKKDQLANTVNKLLSAPTIDEPNIAPLPAPQKSNHNPTKLRNKELEGRREEIAQRIQRIQRRAAASREMPPALDQMPAKIETKQKEIVTQPQQKEVGTQARLSEDSVEEVEHHSSVGSVDVINHLPSLDSSVGNDDRYSVSASKNEQHSVTSNRKDQYSVASNRKEIAGPPIRMRAQAPKEISVENITVSTEHHGSPLPLGTINLPPSSGASKEVPIKRGATSPSKTKQTTKQSATGGIFIKPMMDFIERMTCSMDMDEVEHMDDNDSMAKFNVNEPSSSVKSSKSSNKDRAATKKLVQNEDDWEKFRLNETSNLDTISPDVKKQENWEFLESFDGREDPYAHIAPSEDICSVAVSDLNSVAAGDLSSIAGSGMYTNAANGDQKSVITVSDLNSVAMARDRDRDRDRGLQSTTPSMDSGAFSAAFENGNLSKIPMKKLSLTPTSPLTDSLELETNEHLFFNGAKTKTKQQSQPGAASTSDAYINRGGQGQGRADGGGGVHLPAGAGNRSSFPRTATEKKAPSRFRNRFRRNK